MSDMSAQVMMLPGGIYVYPQSKVDQKIVSLMVELQMKEWKMVVLSSHQCFWNGLWVYIIRLLYIYQ